MQFDLLVMVSAQRREIAPAGAWLRPSLQVSPNPGKQLRFNSVELIIAQFGQLQKASSDLLPDRPTRIAGQDREKEADSEKQN
jgi:hypothetical protein